MRLNCRRDLDASQVDTILDGLHRQARARKGLDRIKPFAVVLEDVKGEMAGGISGTTYYGCLYIDLLYVAESYRGTGHGMQLLNEAEALGRERGCRFATVTTMDWEARGFYERLGYAVEFIRDGYAGDSQMAYLRKVL